MVNVSQTKGSNIGQLFWKRWYFWATHSRLPAMIEAAKLIARHLPNVLTYSKHRITNAVAKGLNSKIRNDQIHRCVGVDH